MVNRTPDCDAHRSETVSGSVWFLRWKLLVCADGRFVRERRLALHKSCNATLGQEVVNLQIAS